MTDRNYSPAYGPGRGQTPPECAHCGQPLRREGYVCKSSFPALAWEPPWNSGWDGKCESCSYDYNLNFVQVLRPGVGLEAEAKGGSIRQTRLRAASKGFRVFIDEGETLSGVEIEITSSGQFFDAQTETIFISTNELKEIISALKDHPFLKQYDWGEDWT